MSDLIDKESAICALMSLIVPLEEYHDFNQGVNNACVEIMKLPSAKQEQKTGKWVEKDVLFSLPWDCSPSINDRYDETTHSVWKKRWFCSECDFKTDSSLKPWYSYCPCCGAYMRGGQDEQAN